MNDWFRKFSQKVSEVSGSAWVFAAALFGTIVWLASGPYYQYNETWNFLANTSTTIITFLMVFLIQNTQNRDAKAIHLKLDELLRAVEGARTSMANLENLPDEELKRIQEEFKRLCEERGISDCEVEAIEDVLDDHKAEKVELAKR
jgi:low affinity Fe/Cu permease